jgi:hypothetical protein
MGMGGTYIVRFRQLTGIGSPKLYPLDSSGLLRGSWPLTALVRTVVNERRARSGRRREGSRGAMVD